MCGRYPQVFFLALFGAIEVNKHHTFTINILGTAIQWVAIHTLCS